MAGVFELPKDRYDIAGIDGTGLRRLDDGDAGGVFPNVLNLQVFGHGFERQEVIFQCVDSFHNQTVQFDSGSMSPLQNHAAAEHVG